MKVVARSFGADPAVLYDLMGVEIFDIGTWNGVKYTDQDLDEMVTNFNELRAQGYDFPVKLGHGTQEILEREDLPAAGYLQRLYRKGTKLAADITRVPEKVKDCVELGAYRTVSAEIYTKVQLLGKTFKNVVSAIAFLGGEIPAVGTLDDIVELYHRPQSRALLFSELAGATRELVTYAKKEETVANKTVEDAQKLHDELVALADRAEASTSGKRGAPSFRALLRESIAKLRAMLNTKKANAVVDSYEDRKAELQEAISEKFGGPDGYDAWLVATFDDYCVIQWGGDYWMVPYTDNDAADVLTLGDPVEVEQTWVAKNEALVNKAITERTTKTTPAKPGGKEEDMATSAAILKALGLPDGADEQAVLKAIAEKDAETTTFKASVDERVIKLETALAERDAGDSVTAAIRAHKLLPAQADWAKSYAAADPKGFASFVEKAPTVIDTTENGSSADAPDAKSPVAEFRAKVAEKVKAGSSVEAAQQQVANEEPELFNAVRAAR